MTNRSIDDQVDEAFRLIACGGRDVDRGILALDKAVGRRLERYFLRHKVHPNEAEELVWEVMFKATKEFRRETRAIVWLWIIARNVLISYHRSRHSNIETDLDDDGWDALLSHTESPALPAWLRLCIERVLATFEQDFPEPAEILRMIIEGWTSVEIAAFLQTSEGAARDRVYRTRMKLEPYIELCKE